jgi:A/G-specific adenine glycosylase
MRGEISDLRRDLLQWFAAHKRPLPWRTQPSVYHTVVSELMLQQTQVATALPYFHRWIARFPDFQSLAAAPVDAVLALWQGLGYYSRARNLHALAQQICNDGLPDSAAAWQQLKGIGPYTAAAIASIHLKQPVPVIDGNVIRVLSRLNNDTRPLRSAEEGRKRFAPMATQLIDPDQPGDFNEAVMELGATVCRKAAPACLICPLQPHCEAAANGNQGDLPVITRKPVTQRTVHRALCVSNNRLLLQRQPDQATRLAGLFELPVCKPAPEQQPAPALTRVRGIANERISESIWRCTSADSAASEPPDATLQWIAIDQLEAIPLSGPHRRWIRLLLPQD